MAKDLVAAGTPVRTPEFGQAASEFGQAFDGRLGMTGKLVGGAVAAFSLSLVCLLCQCIRSANQAGSLVRAKRSKKKYTKVVSAEVDMEEDDEDDAEDDGGDGDDDEVEGGGKDDTDAEAGVSLGGAQACHSVGSKGAVLNGRLNID